MAGIAVIVVVLNATLLAVPPLTQGERGQLEAALDYAFLLDEAALYPLLKNAMAWEVGDESGAAIPQYAPIRQMPASHRGLLYLIEGKLARRQPVGKLARSGPWDGKLEQWVIQWGKTADEVAVVYLVAPPQTVRLNRNVRLVARFYKIWQYHDTQGEPSNFLAFVGRSTSMVRQDNGGQSISTSVLFVIVLALLVVYFVLRSKVLRRGRISSTHSPITRRWQHREDRRVESEEDESGDLLPKDPGDALAELGRRREQDREPDA